MYTLPDEDEDSNEPHASGAVSQPKSAVVTVVVVAAAGKAARCGASLAVGWRAWGDGC